MEGKENPKEFPDIGQKLAAPKKLSAFEKERQAAQAKQQRAEAENAAALKAFENSFAAEDDDDAFNPYPGGRGPPSGPRGPGMGYGPGRYGMPPGGSRSGPGSLGPIPGPPPPSLKRKRALDEMREAQEVRREQEEMMSYEEYGSDSRASPRVDVHDDDRDIDAPRPTVQLSSLPPDMSSDEVKTLLRDYLKVQSVRFLPPSGPGSNSKRTFSAIATLSSDVSTSQIDTAVTALKDKYVGRGFYLSISRHLSSAAFHPSMAATTTSSSEPFGAEKPRDSNARFSMRNAPPPMDQRGFAPPDSYDTPSRARQTGSRRDDAVVSVRPPLDIEAVKAVHTVVDHLLLESDPDRALQKEAMLMSLPEVQRDERFAFLYDSQSPAGIYYRFLLWAPDDIDNAAKEAKRRDLSIERIHQDVPIEWHPPYAELTFPDLKSLEQVVTDIDYVSSDEESDDEDGDRQFNSGRGGEVGNEKSEKKHLTPLQRARFVHLLSRLPTSNARLRKGDVARVTNFAINHAGPGAEEIVDLLLLNIVKPFPYSLAAKYEEVEEQDEEDVYEPDDELSALDSPAPQAQRDSKRDDDPSNAKLIALYLISDILSASSTAGARNAWKYRQLFESGFKAQKTFEHLGRLDKDLAWGRLKSEQWKRKVGVLFGIWEGWSVFSSEVHEELKTSFFEPPLSEEEKAAAQAEAEKEEKKKQEEKFMGKFKRVESVASPAASASPAPVPAPAPMVPEQAADDVDGAPLDDVDGAPLAEDDVDGAPMGDDIEGQPMEEDVDGRPLGGLDGAAEDKSVANGKVDTSAAESKKLGQPSGPRKRMRAEDMFADSDED
jgi:U2-associated protein SR140